MKKLCFLVLVIACIALFASMCFAVSYNEKALSKLYESGKEMDFINSLNKLADQIVIHNKPTFETKYKYKDWEDGKNYTMWDRVWAKDKTIVTALAGKDKKFFSTSLITADPNMIFSGGIRVGADVSVLEKFFKAPISQISFRTGAVHAPAESDFDAESFYIFYDENGKITEIQSQWGIFHPRSDKANTFIKKMRTHLGFPNSNFELLKFD